MKKCFVVAAMAAFVMALSSCGSKAPDINGRWDVVSINGQPTVCYEIALPGLVFDTENQRVYGYTGVNRCNGSFTIDGTEIKFGEVATTMMASQIEAMDQERGFLDALEASVKAVAVKDGVSLRNDKGKEVLHLVPFRKAEDASDEK